MMNNDYPYCIDSIFNFNNGKCYQEEGRLVHDKMEFYQFKQFLSRCDGKTARAMDKQHYMLQDNEFTISINTD